MSKLPIPTGPSNLARRFVTGTSKPAPKSVPLEQVKAEIASIPAERQTKAAKVKAWREANPEAYADQRRRSIAKRRAADKEKK